MNDIRPAPQPMPALLPPQRPLPDKPAPLALKPPTTSKKKWWLLAAITVALLAAGAVAGYRQYQRALAPAASGPARITITIASGDSTSQITDQLQRKGAIRSSLATQIYIRLHGKSAIKAGTYVFSPNQPAAEIVQWLNDGRVQTYRVTILPGKTLAQIRQELIDQGFDSASVDAAFAKEYTHPLLKDKPAGVNLEGYIYPETYFMQSSATAQDVIVRAFDEMQKQINANGLESKLATHGMNLHQGVTLASIVSGEAVGVQDRRQVARVFENRLQAGMTLGSDVTYHYAATLLGVDPSPALDSPYNTRLHTGFPPGAISNFTLDALQAVAQPADNNYLYFVAGDDGVIRYATTPEGHQANVVQFCKKACQNN